MKNIWVFLIVSVLSVGVVFGQDTSPKPRDTALLGSSYVESSVLTQDLKGIPDNLNTALIGVNIPILPSRLDVGGDYNYGWIGGPFPGHIHNIGGSATLYGTVRDGIRPFARARIGYLLSHAKGVGSEHLTEWRASFGVEIHAGRVIFSPQVAYDADTERAPNKLKQLTYQADLDYWFAERVAAFVSIGKTDLQNSTIDPLDYKVGLHFRFR